MQKLSIWCMSTGKKKQTKKHSLIAQKRLDKIKSHTFSGNKYKIAWKQPPKSKDPGGKYSRPLGLCDPPTEPDKTITIDPTQDEKEFLKTIIDEGIHANIWAIDNDIVDGASESIGEFLWRIGFRLVQNPDK